jgi:hypothetical protein
MKVNLGNPAGRLLDLLRRGLEIDPDKNCRLCWCRLLYVEPTDNARLSIRLGKAMSLVDEIKAAVGDCKNIRPEIYLSFAPSVEKAFMTQKLTDQWATFIGHVDTNTMNYLEITSDLLSTQQTGGVIDEKNMLEISRNAENILKELSTSKIEGQIKSFLTRRTDAILEAAQAYRLTGMTGFYELVCAAVGELTLYANLETQLKKTYNGKKFGELLGKVFYALHVDNPDFKLPKKLESLLPESDFLVDEADIVELDS